tara:strand:+ start:1398 stop:1943 length:546 start_codon:yes stop_codon:yes gene_type:complete
MSENFINTFQLEDTSVCDDLIEYFNMASEYKNPGMTGAGYNKEMKDSLDLSVGLASNNPAVKKYIQMFQPGLVDYIRKFHLPKVELAESFLIQKYEPGANYAAWHCERNGIKNSRRALCFMTYLNDVQQGGETAWYWQEVTVSPKKGLCVVWPTDYTHMHAGLKAPNEEKYIVTGWYSFLV